MEDFAFRENPFMDLLQLIAMEASYISGTGQFKMLKTALWNQLWFLVGVFNYFATLGEIFTSWMTRDFIRLNLNCLCASVSSQSNMPTTLQSYAAIFFRIHTEFFLLRYWDMTSDFLCKMFVTPLFYAISITAKSNLANFKPPL